MKSNEDLKKFLLEVLKNIKKVKPVDENNTKEAPAPIQTPVIAPEKTTPSTPPSPERRRRLAPDKWPQTAPGPAPKSEAEQAFTGDIINEMKMAHELTRMKKLVSEGKQLNQEMSMNIEDPNYELPHPSVVRGVEGQKTTPFSDLNFFKGGTDTFSTLEKIGSDEFNKIIRDLKPFGKMSMPEIMTTFNLMSSIEIPNARDLEALAKNKVKEQFGIPEEIMKRIDVKLVKKVDRPNEDTDNLTKEVVKDLNFTEEEKEIIRQHVEKRKIQNVLMMGAGFRAHSVFNSIRDDLDAINPRLYPLYQKVMPNVALFMWQTPIEDQMGGAIMMGLSKLKQDKTGYLKAQAVATIFPILLHETAKAAIEMLFAQYLISLTEKYGANVSSEIIKQSDVFEDEIWMKRIGPTLWKYLHDVIDYVIVSEKQGNYNMVSYLLNDISMMEPADFVSFMTDVIYNGPKSIQKISQMADIVADDLEYDNSLPKQNDPSNLDDMMDDELDALNNLVNAAQQKEVTIETPQGYASMSIGELEHMKQDAINDENYEIAGEIQKEINSRD